jgi:protoporphyrinogen oxidase
VVTFAAPLAARACPELTSEEQRRLRGIRYQGIVCASVLLDRPLAGYYVTNILDEEIPFTGVIEMSSLVSPEHLGGHHLVYLPRYLTAADSFYSLSDEEVRSVFLEALERMYPDFERGQCVAFRVSRARHVLALATLDYSDSTPPMQTSVPGLYVVNSSQIVNGTLNVNETVQLADRAAEMLRRSSP